MKNIYFLALIAFLASIPIPVIASDRLYLASQPIEFNQPQFTGWLGELEEKARQITVRIDDISANENGSGFIVAKEGNTYTVLTCAHVVRNETAKFEILAPDGKRYPVDSATIKKEEGVDLAVVRFTSQENYQTGTLADYNPSDGDYVFVGGYPKLGQIAPKWYFSAGAIWNKEQGILQIGNYSLQSNDSGFTQISATFAGGYEMIYTNISYGGMSGAPVLDTQGRVIGIHGGVEGDYITSETQEEVIEVPLGNSLGISTSTFLALAQRLGIKSPFRVENTPPTQLTQQQQQSIDEAILSVEVPKNNAKAFQWLERGNQLLRLNRNAEAVEAFDRVIKLNDPTFIHFAWYGKGFALATQRQYQEAIVALEQAINYKPDFYPALKEQSIVFRFSNQLEKALVAIDKAIAIQPKNAILYNEKGAILDDLKRYPQAEAAYTQAIQLSPRAVFYNSRGLLYYDQQKWDLAEADYTKAIFLNPNYVEPYYNRGLLYYDQKKWDLAEADYTQAIALNPKDFRAYYNRGVLYGNDGLLDAYLGSPNNIQQIQQKWELAEADFTQAIALEPKLAVAYYSRGFLYYLQQKWELAESDFTQVISLQPDAADAYYYRGSIYYEIGKRKEAIQDLQTAADLYYQLGNTLAYQQLMELLQQLQR